MLDGVDGFDANGFVFVVDQFDEMGEKVGLGEAAALHEGESAGGAEGSGGVGGASVGRLGLDVFHAAKENVRVLMVEGGEGAADGVLSPALRIGLYGIFKEAVEGGEQFGKELSELELADEVGGFGGYEVVAMRQGFAQRIDAGFWGKLTERVEGGELVFEGALAGHQLSVTGAVEPATLT